jgi:TRAP-type uncharacterized transport system substrate-binding protein
MDTPKKPKRWPVVTMLIETFGFSPALATTIALFLALLVVLAVVWVVRSAPPSKIVLTSGPAGSSFQRWALAYQKALAAQGVTVEVRPSAGSLENLQRLRSADARVDIGFVQGGLAKEENLTGLLSLGSVAYQPLLIFYRSPTPFTRLAEFAGRRLSVGAEGSGTRALATTLLQANGVTGDAAVFSALDADAAAKALLDGQLDAVFLMGDSAPVQTLARLMRAPNVQLFEFVQADAYVRRNAYLNKIELPMGSIDLGKNLPAENVMLVGPTVELVVREDFSSALVDPILDVAKEIHGRTGLLQRRGEFPAPLEHEIPLSDDAVRHYKSGKSFLYRTVQPFWVASLLNRILVAIVPLVLVLVPAIRLLPLAYRLSILLRLYRCYRPLLRVERETFGPLAPERGRELLVRLDEIEQTVNRLKVPASFADRFYWLRSHIASVRQRLNASLA